MTAHAVATVGELPPGARKIVEIGGRSIGVFNVGGRFYALRNTCPHQGAPLCRGRLGGTMAPGAPGEYTPERDGLILACPWHGWEFDITTGRSVFNPHRTRVRAYEVTVREPDPGVDTYAVSVADGTVLLHV